MEIIKVVILGIVISLLTLFLKQVKPEYSLLCLIVGSIIIIIYIINYVGQVFDFFQVIVEKTGIPNDVFITMLKIIGVGYLVEFSAGVCRDCGNTSIADKVVLAGKLIIFVISMPIITNVFNMILRLL